MTSVAAGATAYSDADSEMAALTMTAIEIEYVNQFRKMCSEEIPSLRPNFGKAILSWRIANEIEVQAVQSFRNQPDSRRIFDGVVKNGVNRSKASLTVLSTEERRKACLGFLALAKEQNQKIRDRTPKASSYLTQYLKRKPLSDLALEEYEHLMGCAKQAANLGFDYDKADAVCHCQWTVFHENLTREERAEFDAVAMTKDSKSLEWPPLKRIAVPLAMCHRKYFGPP